MSKRRRPGPPPARERIPRWALPALGGAALVAALAVGIAMSARGPATTAAATVSTATPTAEPTPTPTALPASAPATGQVVDGVPCQRMEQVLFHVHAHLAILAGGTAREVPMGIGITSPQVRNGFVAGGACFYWLHSHQADGIIHVESPVSRVFTLGDYFDIWGQPLNTNQVGPDAGQVTVYVDGDRYDGSPRSIPLRPHTVIQLDVGNDAPPLPYELPDGL